MSKKYTRVYKKVFICVLALLMAMTAFVVVLFGVVFPIKYRQEISDAAQEFGVDESLIYAVIWTESKFDKNAKSSAGARGLMQLLPSTAMWCCDKLGIEYYIEKLYKPDYNIRLGVFYLAYLIEKYDKENSLAAYNAGEGNIKKWNGEIKFKETKDYIKRVRFAQRIYNIRL